MQRGTDGPSADADQQVGTGESSESPESGAFGWRGWILVGAIVVAFLVVPALILYLPAARGVIQSIGLTVRDAYLVLPLLPAFGLGAVAVWSAIRTRSE